MELGRPCHWRAIVRSRSMEMACTGNSWTYAELATGVPWGVTIAAKPTLPHQSNKCRRISQLVSLCHWRAIFWGSMQDSRPAAFVTRSLAAAWQLTHSFSAKASTGRDNGGHSASTRTYFPASRRQVISAKLERLRESSYRAVYAARRYLLMETI
jgi:hypothetical protein